MAKKKVEIEFEVEMELRNAFMAQVDPRRRQEVADSRMISEDHYSMSNLSPRFINKQFNPGKYVEKFKPGYDEID